MYPHVILKPEQVVRFWAKVEKRSDDECWFWMASRDGNGYGQFLGRRAHRVSWSLVNGPIPDGLYICHRCDNPPCVNPRHLWADTPGANFRDMVLKGRADSATLYRLRQHRKTLKNAERERVLCRMVLVLLVIAAWEEQRKKQKHRKQHVRQAAKRQKRAAAKATGLNDPDRELEILRLNGLL